MRLPEPVRKLIQELSELPSIGPRHATRLAFYLIAQGKNNLENLSRSLEGLKKIKTCSRCFFIHQNENGICDICNDLSRTMQTIMIVEKETDLLSIEKTGKFKGHYCIIGEIPRNGVLNDDQKLRLENLKGLIRKELNDPGLHQNFGGQGKAEEIILGFNPTSAGDFNASIIAKELQPFTKKISRLGRGLPTGGEIEFADDETLGGALLGRM